MAIPKKDLVKDWFEAWNTRSPERISQFYADDAIFDSTYRQAVQRGKAEIVANLKAFFTDYPDFKIEQRATFYSANGVCGEVVISATQADNKSNPSIPVTRKPFVVRGAYVSEWQNGKVKRHAYYQDGVTVMQQLGLLPSGPAKQ